MFKTVKKYSMVFLSPCSILTLGFQSRISFAFEISGLRFTGSSEGKGLYVILEEEPVKLIINLASSKTVLSDGRLHFLQ